MRQWIRFLLAAPLVFSLSACTSNDISGTTGGGGGGGGGGQNPYIYTARTNSAAWSAGTFVATTSDNGNQVNIVGIQTAESLQVSISLHLVGFRGRKTYDLAGQGSASYAVVEFSRLPQTTGDNGLYITSAAATGSVVVTSYNAHTGDAQGTFQFRTVPLGTLGPSVPDSVAVTEGHFTGRITP